MSCPSCDSRRVEYGDYGWVINITIQLVVQTKHCPDCGHKLPIKRKVKRMLRGCMVKYKKGIGYYPIASIFETEKDAKCAAGNMAESFHEVGIPYEEEVEE